MKQKLFLDFKTLRDGDNTTEYIKLIEKAIDEEKILSFRYTDADSITTSRMVEAVAVTYRWYSWYLFGYCLHKNDYRLFKLSRIDDLKNTETAFTKIHAAADILLSEKEKSDTRQYYDVKLLCKKKIKKQALEYLNGKITEEQATGDFLLTLRVPKNERMWFSLLLGFGSDITVIEPEELKARLKEKAEEILNLYNE